MTHITLLCCARRIRYTINQAQAYVQSSIQRSLGRPCFLLAYHQCVDEVSICHHMTEVGAYISFRAFTCSHSRVSYCSSVTTESVCFAFFSINCKHSLTRRHLKCCDYLNETSCSATSHNHTLLSARPPSSIRESHLQLLLLANTKRTIFPRCCKQASCSPQAYCSHCVEPKHRNVFACSKRLSSACNLPVRPA